MGPTAPLVILAALTLAACARPADDGSATDAAAPAAEAPATAADPEVARRIEDYFAKSVSPGIGLKATGFAPSEVPGWNKGTLQVSAGGEDQEIPFMVTADGRYFMSGELIDLATDPLEEIVAKIDLESRPARGPDDATVTIVEYSDFQCPFCARGYQVIENEVLPAYEGKVRFYFKHLPLKSIHPWAERAALATECAQMQSGEGFWAMYHAIFKHQRDLNEDNLVEKVTGFAKEAGLDADAFAKCLTSEEALEQVQKDLDEATEIGANSTPTFFINGRRLEGAQPLDSFKAVIDPELG